MDTSGFEAELEEAWIEGESAARWRSATGLVGSASGCSVLEVDPGCGLPTHTDSAEEIVIVVAGEAEVTVGAEAQRLSAGSVALVPADVPHSVRCAGREKLRFYAVYAEPDVTTTYVADVQPGGERQRRPLG